MGGKQVLDRGQTVDLENVRLLQNNLSVERLYQSVRRSEDGSMRQLNVLLGQTREVGFGGFGHTDRPRCQVDEVVAIVGYPLVQVTNRRLRPVDTDSWHYVAQHIRFGDRAIDIRNDNLLSGVPKENFAPQSRLALNF